MSSTKEILPQGNGYRLLGSKIENKRLTFGKTEYADTLRNCTLTGCELLLEKAARDIDFLGVTFEHCHIRVKKKLSNFRFTGCRFRHCTFEGTFSGCVFGDADGSGGEVYGCDFSAATLDVCEFHAGTHPESIQWPPWPHIVVLEAHKNAAAWQKLSLPPELEDWQDILPDSETVADVLYLPHETDQPDEVWPLVQDLDFITFGNKPQKPKLAPEQVAHTQTKVVAKAESEKRKAQQQEKYVIWNLLDHLGSIEKIEQNGHTLWITVSTAALAKQNSAAPETLKLALHTISRAECTNTEERTPLVLPREDRFRIMSVKFTDEGVVLGSQNKKAGTLHFCYETFEIQDIQGRTYTLHAIEDLVKKHYGLD